MKQPRPAIVLELPLNLYLCHGQSPEMQLRELREYCERRGWTVAGEYVDTGISGAKDRRPVQRLLTPREAATVLGVSYSTLKKWIYDGKLKSGKTRGGHHRVPEREVLRMIPEKLLHRSVDKNRRHFRRISGRNQLVGRVLEVKYSGLLAQVKLAVGEQHITSITSADAAKELRLKPGERAAALVKSTEVMVLAIDPY